MLPVLGGNMPNLRHISQTLYEIIIEILFYGYDLFEFVL